jgi:hypothetical protein
MILRLTYVGNSVDKFYPCKTSMIYHLSIDIHACQK